MSKLLETLVEQLERPRELSPRVMNYIEGTYSVDRDKVGPFLVKELEDLDDDEIDLMLSPVFTPKLADQALFAELLGRDSVPAGDWPRLVEKLVVWPVRANLVTPDGRSHSVPLRAVSIERYLHRLRLEGSISESLFDLLTRAPSADQPLLKAVARRSVWEDARRRAILEHYLSNAIAQGSYSIEDAVALLDLVESYKPADIIDLLGWIPPRITALSEQINGAAGPKPFFSSRVQYMHGGERDQRTHDEQRLAAKEKELAFLHRLERVL